jgi:glycosyltransferase involved in cell wall biosynthesis
MRAVFVNYSHPNVSHVSSSRLSSFANVLARMGHRVVLLTKSLANSERRLSPQQVSKELEVHNWTVPFHLACVPEESVLLMRQRAGQLTTMQSKLVVVWNYLRNSGMFHDWVVGSREYWDLLAQQFKPEIIWGTFGNTDSWLIAQSIARMSRIPWVMDIKDGWDPFVPPLFRSLIARRFADASWQTSNSEFSAAVARPWFHQPQTTIYSGVHCESLASMPQAVSLEEFTIVISGSLYREAVLREFLSGLRSWLHQLRDDWRSRVRLVYAGSDSTMLKGNIQSLSSLCRVEISGYLPFKEFEHLIRSASVNAYLWSPVTFHHKLLELLACNRPIIAFPGEHEESRSIAHRVSGDLRCCQSPEILKSSLDDLWDKRYVTDGSVSLEALRFFTWEAQAKTLTNVFDKVLRLRKTQKDWVP